MVGSLGATVTTTDTAAEIFITDVLPVAATVDGFHTPPPVAPK